MVSIFGTIFLKDKQNHTSATKKIPSRQKSSLLGEIESKKKITKLTKDPHIVYANQLKATPIHRNMV
jgi:hypothetical protein